MCSATIGSLARESGRRLNDNQARAWAYAGCWTFEPTGDTKVPPIDRDQLGVQFEKYYERYKYVVFNRVRRRLSRYGNPLKQGADDLFQNIFINAFRWMTNYCNEYHQIPPEVIFEKALRKIEATKWVDYFRSRLKHIENE